MINNRNSTNDVTLFSFWCTNNKITNSPLESEKAIYLRFLFLIAGKKMLVKIVLLLLPLAYETTLVPSRPLGFIYGAKSSNVALVEFDVYMGPFCPDSKAAFQTVVKLADHYGPDKLRFRMHLFPLPYHRNSFLVTMVSPDDF